MAKTRLFNIRITEEKHAAFKKYAEKEKRDNGKSIVQLH